MQDEETGKWKVDEEEVLKKRCDFVISAFGSHLASDEVKGAMEGEVEMNKWGPVVDKVNSGAESHRLIKSGFFFTDFR